MFTIDTTSSVAQEIIAAKAIAKSIIDATRDFNVDYILSPFSDPGILIFSTYYLHIFLYIVYTLIGESFAKVCLANVFKMAIRESLSSEIFLKLQFSKVYPVKF